MNDKIEKLQKLDNEKLIDVVKNYRQYGYEESLREAAISLLEERGISREQLKLTGDFENKTYDSADELYFSFKRNSKIAFILYALFLIFKILIPVVGYNFESWAFTMQLANWVLIITYLIFLIKSFMNQSQFYNAIGREYGAEDIILYFFLGMPFYIFMYFYFGNKMKELMKMIK